MSQERRSRVFALLALVAVVATLVAYADVLQQQAGPQPAWAWLQGAPTWLLAVFAASIAVNGAAVAVPFGRARRVALYACAAILVTVGVLAAFSIGVALLLAAVLTITAARTDPSGLHREHAAR